jgi:hypothetical protein
LINVERFRGNPLGDMLRNRDALLASHRQEILRSLPQSRRRKTRENRRTHFGISTGSHFTHPFDASPQLRKIATDWSEGAGTSSARSKRRVSLVGVTYKQGSKICHALRNTQVHGGYLASSRIMVRLARERLRLLQDVGQLMRDQAPPIYRTGFVATVRKSDVVANGIRQSINPACGLRGPFVDMHSHTAEVVTKPRLHESARSRIKRLAGRAQHFVHDWWNSGRMAIG